MNSVVCEHHDDLEWYRHAAEMKEVFNPAASTLYISTMDEVKDLLDVEMQHNGRSWKQSFLGVQQPTEISATFSTRKSFVYAYLMLVDHDKSTGVVNYHLLYDAVENEDGQLTPATSGFFEEIIKLPFPGGYVANP